MPMAKTSKKSNAKSKAKAKTKGKAKSKGKAAKSKVKKKKKATSGKKAKKADPGTSVQDRELYERLRDEGSSKKKSARIANASAASSRREVAARGGSGPAYDEWTKAALYEKAQDVGVPGRSRMNKQQLVDALRSS